MSGRERWKAGDGHTDDLLVIDRAAARRDQADKDDNDELDAPHDIEISFDSEGSSRVAITEPLSKLKNGSPANFIL